ncbi:MAG TPA: nucleoside triphosphate pyrophosphohydrolase [Bacteroidota bacterium]|nr:nucleoside triphosphate pyrophosphohydrolase [Bacteroidota bacterium]
MESLSRLVELTKRLRRECPWDREQTHQSLGVHLIEESYEVVDAIDGGRTDRLRDELGDLLLQVLFHANIAEERGAFRLSDVAETLSAKLIARHPHVFGDAAVSGADQVKENWEKLKMREGRESVLEGLPGNLPALLHAKRVQEKASSAGFDWERGEDVWNKVVEETEELRREVAENDPGGIREEFGDLLFAMVNYARFLKVDPEESLRHAVRKFKKRFAYIEAALTAGGRRPGDATPAEMDALWNESKNAP